MEAFDFAPHVDAPVTSGGAQFVSRAEFDEHMEAIRMLYPKSYDALMARIRALR